MANHRVLAVNRGEKEKVLTVKIEFDTTQVEKDIEKQEIKKETEATYIVKDAIKDSLKG